MTVHHTSDNGRGSWFIEEAGEQLAELVFHTTPEGNISLDGTRVDDRLRGRSAGKQLVQAAVDYARSHGVKIVPVCPFVVALFAKMPEYSDVRATQ
jgi:predicted GNAT family acetyltransferase